MVYSILLESHNGRFRATIIDKPRLSVMANTREQALDKIRAAIKVDSPTSEIVHMNSDGTIIESSDHAWLQFAGMWKDDPTFDEFLQDMADYREEVDATDRMVPK